MGVMRILRVPGVFVPRSDTWLLAGHLRRQPQVNGVVADVCTGSGALAIAAARAGASSVTAIDVSRRALASARINARLNGVRVRTRRSSLLAALPGEQFDLIVSNPPFVIGPGHRYTYRDAGLPGDDVSRRLVEQLPSLLVPGGHAVLLVNWLHLEGEEGDERVRSWIPPLADAWIVQRELAAPEDYVTAWLRDTDEGARFDALYDEWVDALAAMRVEAIAFGVLALRRTDRTPSIVLDVVDQPVAPTWGDEVVDHFLRRDALSDGVLDRAWRLRDDVRLHQVASRESDGWYVESQLLQQSRGLRWTGGTDEHGAALLAGCDGNIPLRTLFSLLAMSAGIAEDEAIEQGLPVVQRLVEQGFLVP
jgi:methylase of polypeptide subunit release factors